MSYQKTPVEELRIASAYLDTAEESFTQAATCLNDIQGQQITYEALLAKFQTTFSHLQVQFSDLEQRLKILIPPSDQNGSKGR